MIIVTGGAGFIGSNFILSWLKEKNEPILNLDKLTYAGNLDNLLSINAHPNYSFIHGDMGDRNLVRHLLQQHQPRAIINFAAESHVDRSIHGPSEFIQTNIVATFHLLEETRAYFETLDQDRKNLFRFLHVSTDEVFGSLSPTDPPFSETTAYQPNSPYSASKAASDHLVRAWHHTYGLPVLTTNCSNNYGPYQFPEKLIPLMISHALKGKPLPIYGDGMNVRDWLYVEDHCLAIMSVLDKGRIGETYNIGGLNEKTNLELVEVICTQLNQLKPASTPYSSLITFVKDRPGHDRRYAINAQKIMNELLWRPRESFESGIKKTILWYLDHEAWVNNILNGQYRQWLETNYQSRVSV
ncbi:MAG: dTDP-glucose 4,6-dehydratase [Ferrovum sp. 37-45-19]|nr:MAG: dTDP-glucose 4,6-dehydratase [Ferrovum sp. 21-44-67]OYV95112.1 MAG: dTDP-glucose 4,6-dehydratase [Ferrovum sp. 37-45-19]OZB31833.1 MAG: dTDP-glucose 4,6-dehydratase [Ferrovum sp. 34-44-207]HQT80822.1 dTDP-glucose 4,6-dehydratase [Ferrovaceae bacterium]HQU06562.1 dTDP-glucose 4,6-dehydratase [Ferrovaceae bacterium]